MDKDKKDSMNFEYGQNKPIAPRVIPKPSQTDKKEKKDERAK